MLADLWTLAILNNFLFRCGSERAKRGYNGPNGYLDLEETKVHYIGILGRYRGSNLSALILISPTCLASITVACLVQVVPKCLAWRMLETYLPPATTRWYIDSQQSSTIVHTDNLLITMPCCTKPCSTVVPLWASTVCHVTVSAQHGSHCNLSSLCQTVPCQNHAGLANKYKPWIAVTQSVNAAQHYYIITSRGAHIRSPPAYVWFWMFTLIRIIHSARYITRGHPGWEIQFQLALYRLTA